MSGYSEPITAEALMTIQSIRMKLQNGASFKRPGDASFYQDISDRLNKYFLRTTVTPRQLKWLKDICKLGLRGMRKAS